ncbi:hypothetical protein VB1_CDS0001, partial [Arthrobacter phage Marchesin]
GDEMGMHEEHMSTALNTAAALGHRVAVFANTHAEARAIFLDMAGRVPEGYAVEVRRLNGGESLTFEESGGRIRFYSLRGAGYRGERVDRLFVPVGTSPEQLLDIWPAMQTSSVRVLTGY